MGWWCGSKISSFIHVPGMCATVCSHAWTKPSASFSIIMAFRLRCNHLGLAFAWPGEQGDERWFLKTLPEKENAWNYWIVYRHCTVKGAGFNVVTPGSSRIERWWGRWAFRYPPGAVLLTFALGEPYISRRTPSRCLHGATLALPMYAPFDTMVHVAVL